MILCPEQIEPLGLADRQRFAGVPLRGVLLLVAPREANDCVAMLAAYVAILDMHVEGRATVGAQQHPRVATEE